MPTTHSPESKRTTRSPRGETFEAWLATAPRWFTSPPPWLDVQFVTIEDEDVSPAAVRVALALLRAVADGDVIVVLPVAAQAVAA
jgi:hypothetical protein